ncbi:MAG: HAMP domain-containing sensor histidine kinase [Pseudomonadota bacterium]
MLAPGENAKISLFDAKFASEELERAYRTYARDRNRSLNLIGVQTIFVVIILFHIADWILYPNPLEALIIRCVALVVAVPLYLGLRREGFWISQESNVMAIVIILALAFNAIIWRHPESSDVYYFGFMQGAVIFGYIFRITFLRSLAVFVIAGSAFVFAVSGEVASEKAFAQSAALVSVFAVSAVGVYFLEHLHRADFVKTMIIRTHKDKLAEMLNAERLDNERKVAAMSMLVHFIRTPIHQISGFTDVVLAHLQAGASGERESDGCIESAGFIKTASKDLLANVSRILEYHRLDEMDRASEPDRVDLSDIVRDAADRVEDFEKVAVEAPPCVLRTNGSALRTALERLAENVNDHAGDATAVRFLLSCEEGGARIDVADDGPAFSQEAFERHSMPLTQLADHLNATGASMPMGLRIARRAAEVCGGGLTFNRVEDADGRWFNVFSLRVAERDETRNDDGGAGDLEIGLGADVDAGPRLRLVS